MGIIGTRYPNPFIIAFLLSKFANLTPDLITLFNLKFKNTIMFLIL